MFQAVHNEYGVHLPNAWWPFSQELMKDHTPVVKIEFLYPGTYAVDDWIVSGGTRGEVTNVVTDGNVDLDITRGTRRTAEITLLNPTAEFTPSTGNFSPEGAWVGKIYLNRLVRIWRGVEVEGQAMMVPVGTFMVDTAEVIAEENMSLVNLTMSDQWKRLTKSAMGHNKKYPKGTPYNTIISDIISFVGLPTSGPLAPWLDPLHNRPAADKTINRAIKLKRGDNRGKILKELTWSWGIDAFFNVWGRFKTYDRFKMSQKQTVWWFASRPIDAYGRHGGLISLTRSFNDDNLYNHVVVVGTGNKKKLFKRGRVDDNPWSKTRRAVLGDRVYYKETDKLHTQAQVDRALERIWKRRNQLGESIRAEVICNPALDVDDVIRIREDKFVKVDGRYRIDRMNIPLVTSRQEIEANVILRREDW